MGATVSSYDELKKKVIEKNTPKEVCPPDEVFAIKKKHLERITQLVTTEWEYYKRDPYNIELSISINECKYVDSNSKKVYVNGHSEYVPEKYKNGFDIIVHYKDVVSIIESIINVPHIIRYENGHIFRIYIVRKFLENSSLI